MKVSVVRVKTVLYPLCIKELLFGHRPKNYPVPLLQHYAEVQLSTERMKTVFYLFLCVKELLLGYPQKRPNSSLTELC